MFQKIMKVKPNRTGNKFIASFYVGYKGAWKKPRCNKLLSIKRQKVKYSRYNFSVLCICSIYLCCKSHQIIWIFTQRRNSFGVFLLFRVLFLWVLVFLFLFLILNSSVWATTPLDIQNNLLDYGCPVNFSSILVCVCSSLQGLMGK